MACAAIFVILIVSYNWNLKKLSLKAKASVFEMAKFLTSPVTCLSNSKKDFTISAKTAVGMFFKLVLNLFCNPTKPL